jgi:hypothetical protein
VLGDQQSDDPFCRDMCRRTGMTFVSVGYRHAPEHRFPTAAVKFGDRVGCLHHVEIVLHRGVLVHTHESFDAVIGATRVVSNAKGYGPWPGQQATWDNQNFNENLIIEI